MNTSPSVDGTAQTAKQACKGKRPLAFQRKTKVRRTLPASAAGSATAQSGDGAAELLSWLSRHGAFVDGIRVETRHGAGRCLVAARDLPCGTTFCRLPASCVLSPNAALKSQVGVSISKKHQIVCESASGTGRKDESSDEDVNDEVDRILPTSVLLAFLMTAPAAAAEEDHAFGPFLAHLRRRPGDTPHSWSTADRARLPAEAQKTLESYEAHLMGQYMALFPAMSESFPETFPVDVCTEAAWRSAHALYTSHAFPAEPGNDMDGVLLPLLDCMNHDSEAANVEWLGVGLADAQGARVTRPVLEGEELLYSYGCKGNAELVIGYGFALWDNPHELVRLDFDLSRYLNPSDAAWLEFAESLAQAAVGGEARGVGHVAFQLRLEDFDEEVPCGLLNAAALLGKVAASASAASEHSTGREMGQQEASASSAREMLKEMMLQAGEALMCRSEIRSRDGPAVANSMSGEAWGRYERAVRRRDSVRVGSHLCAGTPEGCAVATRSAQLQVLTAALDLLEEA